MSSAEMLPIAAVPESMPPMAARKGSGDEQRFISKAKSGEESAFGQLYERYQQKVRRTTLCILHNRQDAEDASQRAFQRAFVNLERFRGESTFSTWVTRIAINEALMMLRKRRTREQFELNGQRVEEDGPVEIADRRPTPEEILSERERRAALLQAIAQLQGSLRTIVLHRELQGLTSAETAQRLGLTVTAVKARTIRAKRFLRKYLERSFRTAHTRGKSPRRRVESYEGIGNTIV
jgi:RNA polymerase sigma-70 factor, ECF subfamily